QPQPSPPVQG
ncbi:hypothetical protein ECEC1868_5887, partial [Escherichia coli EC1868]